MIAWGTIKQEIATAMLAISGLPAAQVIWRDEAQAATWKADPLVSMRLGSTSRRGIEEVLYTANAANDQTVEVSGQRDFVLSIRAESFTQDIASPVFAANVLDQIAIRIMRPSTRALITSFAIQTREPTQFFNYKSDGRQMSCYVLDIHCGTEDVDLDTTPGAGGFINEVQIAGTVDSTAVSVDVKGT